jgi:murein DD-endopeptidase MepM/ murein hydrolase activator NlpD
VSKEALVALLLGLLLVPLLFLLLLEPDQGGPLAFPQGPTAWHSTVVQAGDTLSDIADRYGVPLAYLVATNDLFDPRALLPGQEIIVPSGGVVHTVKPGQTLADLALTYGVTEEAISAANGGVGELVPGERLLIPHPSRVPQAAALELGPPRAGFIWPLRGRFTSGFGPRTHPVYGGSDFHTGIDLAVPVGTPVRAAAPGEVIWAGWRGNYGLLVVLDHQNGYSTYYAHLSQLRVSPGQFVELGQVVALSGNSGLSTGPHLHFEIRRWGEPLDPLPLLP